jgi:hypothetical protein
MKHLFTSMILIFFGMAVSAQIKASIDWTFSAKKLVAENTYEITIVANPPAGWHVYSQFTPEGGPVPTAFTFNKNALLSLEGKTRESGKIIEYFDKNFNVKVKYFDHKAVFTQIVKVKGKIKTNISGEVESMICNDRTCMPPITQKFSIPLN